MHELTSLLCTKQPKIMNYDPGLFSDIDAMSWAVNLCKENSQKGLRIEAMRPGLIGEHNSTSNQNSVYTIHCDPTKSQAVDEILNSIAHGFGGHASLDLLHVDNTDNYHNFEPAYSFYRDTFMEGLNRIYQLGHYCHATLWFSASAHVYGAHIDLEDGFLFQFFGTKRVKVWSFPEEHCNAGVFNHAYLDRYADRTYRETLPYTEFQLEAGEVLYIPAGAVHEVTTDEDLTSLSISYHLGCPYPILALCSELNTTYQDHQFRLPKKYCGNLKHTVSLINPEYESLALQSNTSTMPHALQDHLCKAIQTDCNPENLSRILDEWWRNKIANPTALRGNKDIRMLQRHPHLKAEERTSLNSAT